MVELVKYPSTQPPLTYDEMVAPDFDIDPDDFTTPEQILSKICENHQFDKIIFGHLEEVSGSLYLVARIYSKANNQITLVQPVQTIKIEELEVKQLEAILEQLALKMVSMMAAQ